MKTDRPRIALAHDWLCGIRGGEIVLDRIAKAASERGDPSVLLSMFDDGAFHGGEIANWPRRASWLNRLPGSGRLRRWLLPLYPLAVSGLAAPLQRLHRAHPISLLISSSSAAIKGLRPPEGVPHLCYCHAPARYVWSIGDEYGGRSISARCRQAGLAAIRNWYQAWDRRTAQHVTTFVANSKATQSRIRECFGRDSAVVHPPVDTDFFTPGVDGGREKRGDFWLLAGAIEPYKRADLAIAAARSANRRLVIAGSGSGLVEAMRHADGDPRIVFEGAVSRERMRELFRSAEALVYPQIEDFGIIAVEAQACGLPVIARRAGGALESVIEGRTGIFFEDAHPDAIVQAARSLPSSPEVACREHALRFTGARFDQEFGAQVDVLLGSRANTT